MGGFKYITGMIIDKVLNKVTGIETKKSDYPF